MPSREPYPKTYGTVVGLVDKRTMRVRTDDGEEVWVRKRARLGECASAEMGVGLRIKLFIRPCDRDWHWRKVGE